MSHKKFFLSKLTKLEFVRRHATLTKKNHWQELWWDHGEGTCTAHHVETYLFLFAWRQQDAACSCITTETAESSLQWQGGAKGEWGVGSSHRIPSFSLDFHKLSMQFQKCGQSKMSQLYADWRQKRPTFTEQTTWRQWSHNSVTQVRVSRIHFPTRRNFSPDWKLAASDDMKPTEKLQTTK